MKKRIIALLSVILAFIMTLPVTVAEQNTTSFPEYYFEDCPEHGIIENCDLSNNQFLVWTPHTYNIDTKYDVVILIHGSDGDMHDWMDTTRPFYFSMYTSMNNIYDWVTYENKVTPFIVVTLNDNNGVNATANLIVEIMSYIADNYSTYAKSGSEEALIAARNHFILGGLSKGCHTTFYFLQTHIQYIGNYICLSMSLYETNNRFYAQGNNDYRINTIFFGMGKHESYEMQWAMNRLSPYSDNSTIHLYPWGHDWFTWPSAFYDALLYTIPFPTSTNTIPKPILYSINIDQTDDCQNESFRSLTKRERFIYCAE